MRLCSLHINLGSSNIAGSFKDRYLDEETPSEAENRDLDKMPLEDVMSNWFQNLDGLEDGADPNPDIHDLNRASSNGLIIKDPDEELEEEEQESAMPELYAYQDFIFKSPAYEWLLATLRKEFLLAPAKPNSMEAIRREILHSLPSSHKVSRKKSPQAYKVAFRIKWDPLAFVKEQGYGEEPCEAVKTAITLTGSAGDAQALTCGQYLRQTWPLSGEHTIRLLKDVVRSGPGYRHTCKFPRSN